MTGPDIVGAVATAAGSAVAAYAVVRGNVARVLTLLERGVTAHERGALALEALAGPLALHQARVAEAHGATVPDDEPTDAGARRAPPAWSVPYIGPRSPREPSPPARA